MRPGEFRLAISVQCATCGKRYHAADHMAGRRMRCKNCGATFQLPAAPTSDEPFEQPQITDADATISLTHHFQDRSPTRPTPELNPPFGDEPFDPNADVDSVFQEAFQEYAPSRGNTPFVFPGSKELDRWVPAVLVTLSVAWLAYQTLGSRVETDGYSPAEPGWVGPVRLLVLLLTYAGVVFPICLKGTRMAARKLNYELPSGSAWRAFATFLLPVTIGCVVWLSNESVPGFILGILLGSIVAMPIMWLLFRIRNDDAPVSLGYGAGAFGAGVLASVVILVVLNLIVVGVVRGTKAKNELVMSPFGPGFAWDPPAPREVAAKTKQKKPAPSPERGVPVSPTTKAFSDDTVGGDASTRPSPDAVVVTRPAETGASPATTQESIDPTNPGPGVPPVVVDPASGIANAVKSAIAANTPIYGTVVAELFERVTGEMESIVYPLLPGSAVAIVKKTPRLNEDSVELWSTADWQPKRTETFARPVDGVEGYELSLNGALFVRLTDFPSLQAQIHSFAEGALLRPIKFDRNGPTPQMLGFCASEELLVLSSPGGQSTIDIWDASKSKKLKRFETPAFSTAPGNYAISRDGKLLAIIVRDDAAATGRLEIYNLITGKLTRKIIIDELQWHPTVKPSGLSFNETGDKIATLFEHEGQGLFLCWGEKDNIPIHQHVYPGGLLPDGLNTTGFRGQAFALVDDGQAWLLYGASVFDSKTGKLLGDLKIKNIKSQRVVSSDTVLFEQEPEPNQRTLLEVRLDVGRVRREAASAGGGKPQTKP